MNEKLVFHYICVVQGDHSNCHQESRCQEEGYVCSKKPLVTAQAIAAYQKAIVGTTIYKFAEDYALVILIHMSIPMAWYCIYCPQICK